MTRYLIILLLASISYSESVNCAATMKEKDDKIARELLFQCKNLIGKEVKGSIEAAIDTPPCNKLIRCEPYPECIVNLDNQNFGYGYYYLDPEKTYASSQGHSNDNSIKQLSKKVEKNQ